MFSKLYTKKVDELRKECKDKQLPTKGKKIELIQHLFPEAKEYEYLDKKLNELKKICKEKNILISNSKWADIIVSLNIDKLSNEKITITITKLDSTELKMEMDKGKTIGFIKTEIIQTDGMVDKYIELYTDEGIPSDSKTIYDDAEFTMVINTIPTVNPYTGRELKPTSEITKNLMKCYSEPNVFFVKDGKLSFTNTKYDFWGKFNIGENYHSDFAIPLHGRKLKIEYPLYLKKLI